MPDFSRLQYFLINAFSTGQPGSGNQASVVLFDSPSDPRAEDDAFLLRTAQDFGFAETACLVPLDPQAGRWGLRWFTTEVEVPICGHATLAAAKVVLSLYPQIEQVHFETRFWGELVCKRVAAVDETSLEIQISLSTLSDSALRKLVETGDPLSRDLAAPLADVLGIEATQVLSVGEFEFVDKSLIVEVAPEVDLGALKVDPKALVAHSPAMTIVTQMRPDLSSPSTLRTHTRVFWLGYMEDPVTGSAHAFITGFYLLTPAAKRIPSAVLQGGEPKNVKLDARQLSRRGGKLVMTLAEGGMVQLTGTAAEWGKGSLTV